MNQFVQRVANYIANVSPPEVSRSFLVPSMHRCDTPLCSLTISFRRCTSFKQEIFIKGLANSKTFQKFAVHTDRHITKIKKEGMETLNTHVDELHKQATKAAFSTSSNSSGGTSSKGSTLMPPTKPFCDVTGPEKVVLAIEVPLAQGFAAQSVQRQVGTLSAWLMSPSQKTTLVSQQKKGATAFTMAPVYQTGR